jgi:peroxiredoxin
LQARIDEFEAVGARIIAVSPDSEIQNAEVARNLGVTFPILSDSDLEATRALGLLHEGGAPPPSFSDIPRPAVFIVRDGTIRWRALTDNWRVRVRPDALLEALARSPGADE